MPTRKFCFLGGQGGRMINWSFLWGFHCCAEAIGLDYPWVSAEYHKWVSIRAPCRSLWGVSLFGARLNAKSSYSYWIQTHSHGCEPKHRSTDLSQSGDYWTIKPKPLDVLHFDQPEWSSSLLVQLLFQHTRHMSGKWPGLRPLCYSCGHLTRMCFPGHPTKSTFHCSAQVPGHLIYKPETSMGGLGGENYEGDLSNCCGSAA